MDWIAALIGGLGIGSVLTRAVEHFLSRRGQLDERTYQEMREAYLGLLGALHQAAVKPSLENAKNFALWHIRCELFGSKEVSNAAQKMIDTNEGPSEARQNAHRSLIDAMKNDLHRH